MIVAFDTFYFEDQAKTVALAFADWTDPEPFEIYSELLWKLKIPVFRSDSKNPLFVTSIGTNLDLAAQNVAKMHGDFRLPTLLKKLDQLTKIPN